MNLIDDNDIYYEKYLKYKRKYLEAKHISINIDNLMIRDHYGGSNEVRNNKTSDNETHKNEIIPLDKDIGGFYIVHNPNNYSNLLSILKSGFIYPGKMVHKKRRIYSGVGGPPLNYVYGNIFFDDIRNLSERIPFIIMLKPDVMYDHNVFFNEGWFRDPNPNEYNINVSDSDQIKNQKIIKIKNYLKNPTYYKDSPISHAFTGVNSHELLFDPEISLKDHLLGVRISDYDDKKTNKIKKLLAKKYPSVKFYNNIDEFPDFKQIVGVTL